MTNTTFQCANCETVVGERLPICPHCNKSETIRRIRTSQLPTMKKPIREVSGVLIKAALAEQKGKTHNERLDEIEKAIENAAKAKQDAIIPREHHKLILDMCFYYRLEDEDDF